jgi:hypothetical protein
MTHTQEKKSNQTEILKGEDGQTLTHIKGFHQLLVYWGDIPDLNHIKMLIFANVSTVCIAKYFYCSTARPLAYSVNLYIRSKGNHKNATFLVTWRVCAPDTVNCNFMYL